MRLRFPHVVLAMPAVRAPSVVVSMTAHRAVFHGTSIAYTELIRENGLVPPPGHGKGVRVRLELEAALADAQAWAAYVTYRSDFAVAPRGIVVAATVPEEWLRDRDGTLRVEGGIGPDRLTIRGPHEFPELLTPIPGTPNMATPAPAFWRAIERWEELTSNAGKVAIPMRRAAA